MKTKFPFPTEKFPASTGAALEAAGSLSKIIIAVQENGQKKREVKAMENVAIERITKQALVEQQQIQADKEIKQKTIDCRHQETMKILENIETLAEQNHKEATVSNNNISELIKAATQKDCNHVEAFLNTALNMVQSNAGKASADILSSLINLHQTETELARTSKINRATYTPTSDNGNIGETYEHTPNA
jgi:hypothetical protein